MENKHTQLNMRPIYIVAGIQCAKRLVMGFDHNLKLPLKIVLKHYSKVLNPKWRYHGSSSKANLSDKVSNFTLSLIW